MDEQTTEFAALMERFAQGDQQAATELYNKYNEAVIRVVRYHLARFPRLRWQYDSIDFSQSVWASVFFDPEKLRDFAQYQDFLMHIWNVTRHKIDNARRKHLGTQKRDLRRTRHLGDSDVATAAGAVADPEPSPLQQVLSHELWQCWLTSLPPRTRTAAVLLAYGYHHRDIAKQLGCSLRSIERVVAKLRRKAPPGMFP